MGWSKSLWTFSSISTLLERDRGEVDLCGSGISTLESDADRVLDSGEVGISSKPLKCDNWSASSFATLTAA